MAETKAYTYDEDVRRIRLFRRIAIRVSKRDIFARVVGFFLAMAMPLPGVAPFGMAYLAQERKLTPMAVFSFLMTSLGSMVVCDRLGSARYMGAGIIYLCTLFILEKGIVMNDITSGLIAACSIFITGLAVLIIEGFSVLGLVLLLCEAALVVSGTLMMEKSLQIIRKPNIPLTDLDGDTRLSLAAVALAALLGLKELYLGSAFSVMNCLAVVLLLVVSIGGGAGYSTGTGVILGIVCGIGGEFFMPILGAFGFCGFLSGAFSRFGKGGAIAGVILANGIMAVYTNSAMESILTLWEILAAACMFAFIPKSWLEMVREIVCLDQKDRESIARVKENIRARLGSAAQAFATLSTTMERLSDKKTSQSDDDIAVIFDATADKVCSRCRKCTVCWGQNFNTTYNEMFSLLNIMKEKGVAKAEDIKEHFAAKCLNMNGFLDELNHQFDLYRVRQSWRSKLCESRELLGKQLGGVSEILEGITAEIGDDTKKAAVSGREIQTRLEIGGIKPQSVKVTQDKHGRCCVELIVKASKCQGKERRTIEKIMKSYAGCSRVTREDMLENKKLVRLIFTEAKRFEVETECASVAASDKNGDNFRFLSLENGKFIIAISDGMGTGSRAAKESEAILELLDSFLQAGFDSGVAVRLINSIMIIKSEESMFVTLDLCIIDLYTGEVKFIKTGAEPSFILSETGRVRTINASSLPVGLIAQAEAEVSDTKIQDGDRIVMITDGVENRENGSLWIRELMQQKDKLSEDENLAQKILCHATDGMGDTAKDDMTVLSIKLKAVG